jgi:hypothetical protein
MIAQRLNTENVYLNKHPGKSAILVYAQHQLMELWLNDGTTWIIATALVEEVKKQ